MGMYHLLSLTGDVNLGNKEEQEERRAELEAAIGKATYTLCFDPQYGYLTPPKLEQVTDADILNRGSAIRHAGEFHHSETVVMVFYGGSLRKLDELSNEEFQDAYDQFKQAAEQRKGQSQE